MGISETHRQMILPNTKYKPQTHFSVGNRDLFLVNYENTLLFTLYIFKYITKEFTILSWQQSNLEYKYKWTDNRRTNQFCQTISKNIHIESKSGSTKTGFISVLFFLLLTSVWPHRYGDDKVNKRFWLCRQTDWTSQQVSHHQYQK